ncbi:MAG: phosphate/phosphite/phosphonate ABC transporter substrate-binding protein [Nitrospirae bacterium]|nr:MAG: phosphate/phosphite/phosphonate ABC transporter substrate-binding protein [Nitrospirota bacterium]
MKKLSICVVFAMHMFLSSAFAASETSLLTFGVYPYDTPTQIYQNFEPLMKYLSKKIGIPVRLVIAPNYMSHIINIGEGRVDLGFMGPSPYIRAKDKYGSVELLARLMMRDNKNDRLVVISHKQNGINALKDLKGKTFAFGDYQSYGSHFYPRFLLNKNGVRLNDMKSYDFLGSHSKVLLAVSHKDFDAGGVREDIYEKYRDRPVKVIAGPFTIPPHVIVCRKDLPAPIKAKAKALLIELQDKGILQAIDPALERFGPVRDGDFRQAREVVDFIEGR